MAGLVVSILAAAAAGVGALGSRLGWWPFQTGFEALRVSLALAVLGLLSSLLTSARHRRRAPARLTLGLIGVAVSAGILANLFGWRHAATLAPMIHDISTDTQNPPAFFTLLPERLKAPNGAAYGGPEIAAKQKAAYPDIQPLVLSVPPAAAFDRALAAAKNMGWAIASADASKGVIEATATTRWFGFKDDVIVRVRPEGSGSRVDARSVSRVGKGDVGTNASRIRAYLAKLRD